MIARSRRRPKLRPLAPWRAGIAVLALFALLPGLLELHADHPAFAERVSGELPVFAGCHPDLGDHIERPVPRERHPCAACLHRLALSGIDLGAAIASPLADVRSAPSRAAERSLRSVDVSASSSRGPPLA